MRAASISTSILVTKSSGLSSALYSTAILHANSFCGLCLKGEKCHWLLRTRQHMRDRKCLRRRQRSLPPLILPLREIPLLAGKARLFSPSFLFQKKSFKVVIK